LYRCLYSVKSWYKITQKIYSVYSIESSLQRMDENYHTSCNKDVELIYAYNKSCNKDLELIYANKESKLRYESWYFYPRYTTEQINIEQNFQCSFQIIIIYIYRCKCIYIYIHLHVSLWEYVYNLYIYSLCNNSGFPNTHSFIVNCTWERQVGLYTYT